ncbi:MAG: dCMP deaminase family protein [Chloroflexi bacterium]|nr:dCMP deaminase family protein [Chloroflexota bacterium]
MGIALAVRKRANCSGRKVGAVVVKDNRILSTGYNGTPSKLRNCEGEMGCSRCASGGFEPGTGYDLCICVHAEQNALLAAARFGVAVERAQLYTTLQPCLNCLKEIIQAGIQGVRYLHPWYLNVSESVRAGVEADRRILETAISRDGFYEQLIIDDPEMEWALGKNKQ